VIGDGIDRFRRKWFNH
jgi:hypothetical protein